MIGIPKFRVAIPALNIVRNVITIDYINKIVTTENDDVKLAKTMANLGKQAPYSIHTFKEVELLRPTSGFDRNNNLIYVGDLLRTPSGTIIEIKEDYQNGHIYVDNPNSAVTIFGCFTTRNSDIIGNIYENADLLDKRRKIC